MKQSVHMKLIQDRMGPGEITRDGFLGPDLRTLDTILIEDDATVRRLGTTHKAIADRMQTLRDAAVAGLGDPIMVGNHHEVTVDVARGKLPCPFAHSGMVRKSRIVVRHLPTGKAITYTDLAIHLIGAHGFYQGKGSPYRLEPALLVELLEVLPCDDAPELPQHLR